MQALRSSPVARFLAALALLVQFAGSVAHSELDHGLHRHDEPAYELHVGEACAEPASDPCPEPGHHDHDQDPFCPICFVANFVATGVPVAPPELSIVLEAAEQLAPAWVAALPSNHTSKSFDARGPPLG
jgi:hypothetical protein